MKKYLLILFIFLSAAYAVNAQDGIDEQRGGKLLERLQKVIQEKLNFTKAESEKFSPVFFKYITELKKTHKQYAADVVLRNSKIAEVRLQFRDRFKEIINEQRANKVFDIERNFMQRVREEIQSRREESKQRPATRQRFLNPKNDL